MANTLAFNSMGDFIGIQCVCTSSELNAERPKTPLKEHTFDKAFKLKHSQWFKLWMSTEEVQKISASNTC